MQPTFLNVFKHFMTQLHQLRYHTRHYWRPIIEPCKHNRKVARPSEIKRKDAVAMANRAVAEKATTRLYETQQDRKKKLILGPGAYL